ncbi:hypothetical protein A2576_04570 [Candidatus Amesbacteria bacterium RIFOXYD1_FULL_47_9]|uniref:Uncharacterized protein n=4 Tax=Candidatus Amesiibacteriota TaxID=1752730 RepID=A0A1F4ZE96_9BACT|nr:MAG: hypothetical protein UX78_C0002G0021 [Candidatus Amesbacteria bacterium GW2011_GWA2_47_11]KKU94602.1 MAG: hypothetical protein UY22_C0011G0009 [Candidatus Amesbacteria bacterium GW2011_GWC1_48_10]OGD01612.1 MAG: hypothetical protein A2354_04310 [Candidatus Amesbacteria bacterium RIFOXYB1_FULL_47_12]OGD04508.1 MAG: hypothetical protein A3E17_03935 [Candidatus Amesbacteria bacterium RIFCSPHIGHO2_12_FULL_48_14]OGD11850.1 MAG: hypothetical protein A2576_04570 [Candidatus Amesbacteria bacter
MGLKEIIISGIRRLASQDKGEMWFRSLSPEIRQVLMSGTDEERRNAVAAMGLGVPADGLSYVNDLRSTAHPERPTGKGERIKIR